jgi:hypothetical protein
VVRLFKSKETELDVAVESLRVLIQNEGLLSIFDGIEEIIYVAKLDHEMVWANKEVIKRFGADYKGKKCYEYLQGFHHKCSFCTNPELKKLGLYNPIKWTYTNPKTKDTYHIIDMLVKWNGSGNVRMEIACNTKNYGQQRVNQKTS